MTAAKENSSASADEVEQLSGPGDTLHAAREAAGMSVDDVAHALHLEASVIVAIESGNLDKLGAPVFVKGYLRSYARLLGLPEQELVDSWRSSEPDPDEFRSFSMQTEVKSGASLSIFVLWLLLGVLVLGSLIYLLSGGDEVSQSSTVNTAPVVKGVTGSARDAEFVVAENSAAEFVVEDESAIAEPVSDFRPAQVSEPEPPPAKAAADDSITVQLTFKDECWVELSDASRRLLYGLEKAGSVRSFKAKPPLRFFVGNVDAVGIRLSGKGYTIPKRMKTGRNTARFVLHADDIQRLQ